MPNTLILELPKWETSEDLLDLITSRKKRYSVRRFAVNMEHQFEVNYKSTISKDEAIHYFRLFENIKDTNFAFNFFKFPKKMPEIISKYKEWEFIDIKVKGINETVACLWSYVGKNHYSPLIIGLNYDYLESHKIYKQTVFQIVKRGNILNKKRSYLGFSAEFEKSKYMAKVIETFAFMKVDNTFNLDVLDSYSNN